MVCMGGCMLPGVCLNINNFTASVEVCAPLTTILDCSFSIPPDHCFCASDFNHSEIQANIAAHRLI